MARITIEDCMEQVGNRFHLVRMASIRAKQLKKGARPLLVSEENKEVVMSLREIAAGLVKPCRVESATGELVPAEGTPAATDESAASTEGAVETQSAETPSTPEATQAPDGIGEPVPEG
jgi:DNA-directed RNA polymerase subunit omega